MLRSFWASLMPSGTALIVVLGTLICGGDVFAEEGSPAEQPEAQSEGEAVPEGDEVEPESVLEPQPTADLERDSTPEPPPTEEPEVSEEELRLLEESLGADRVEAEEISQNSPAPASPVAIMGATLDIALILDVAAAYFTEEPQQTGAHDPNRTGFTLQQLEMSISSNIDPYLSLNVNMVFAEFGVEVEEAYFSTTALPWSLKLRGGQFITNFGRLNNTHPHSWSFLDQPLVNGKFFGGESSRGLGGELSWLSPLPWFVELIGSATMATGECCARSFYGGQDLGVDGIDDLLYTTALKQFFPISSSLSFLWGLSGQFGPNPTGLGNRTEIYGTDIFLRWRPVDSVNRTALSLQAELMVRRRQVPRDILQDLGGYAQVVWNMTPRWETGLRFEHVTGLADDPLESIFFDDRQRSSAQLTFYPSHFSRFRLQAMWDRPTYLEHDIFGVMLGAEVLAGSHGAHAY